MVRRCVVCRIRSSPKPPDIDFFRIPANPQEKAKWLSSIGMPYLRTNSTTCVCSKHFRPEDFWPRFASGCLTLRPNAVPFADIKSAPEDAFDPSLMCSVSIATDGPSVHCKEEIVEIAVDPWNQAELEDQDPLDQLVFIKEEKLDEESVNPPSPVEDALGNIRVEQTMYNVKMEVNSEEECDSELGNDPLTIEKQNETLSSERTDNGDGLVEIGETQTSIQSPSPAPAPKCFPCADCSYVGKTSFHLKRHMAKHLEEKQFHDQEKQFYNQDCSLKSIESAHIEWHIGQNPDEKPTSEQLEFCANSSAFEVAQEIFHCDHCKYVGSTKALLRRHMKRHNGEKALKCTECSFLCTDSSILKMHVRKHTGEKPVHCIYCSYESATASQLKRHLRTHSGEKPFHCTECNYVCADATNLKNHIRTHTGQNLLRCMQCDYTCVTSTHLKRHMRSHTGEKPFQCEECKADFAQSGDLKRHMRRHTGERPYRCNECGLKFAQSSTLKKHTRTHSAENNLSCSESGYVCEDSSALQGVYPTEETPS